MSIYFDLQRDHRKLQQENEELRAELERLREDYRAQERRLVFALTAVERLREAIKAAKELLASDSMITAAGEDAYEALCKALSEEPQP